MNDTQDWKTLPEIAAGAPDGYGTRTLNRLATDPDSGFPAPVFKGQYYSEGEVKSWIAVDNATLLGWLGLKYSDQL